MNGGDGPLAMSNPGFLRCQTNCKYGWGRMLQSELLFQWVQQISEASGRYGVVRLHRVSATRNDKLVRLPVIRTLERKRHSLALSPGIALPLLQCSGLIWRRLSKFVRARAVVA